MNFSIKILGCSSALPTVDRFPSAQVVSYNQSPMLVDCGEGTQIQLRRNKISFLKIEHIFISHLHGDHYYGIFGLLTTMNLMGRKKPLHLYAPSELLKIINYLWRATSIELLFKIEFHPLEATKLELIAETKHLEIYTFPLEHSKPNWGFKFIEKPHYANIRKEMIERYQLGIADIRNIKLGHGVYLDDGSFVEHLKLTHPAPAPRSYTYCSDTVFLQNLNNIVGDTTVLYHEATFAQDATDLAAATGHSTSIQAAQAAIKLNAKALIIGHYSTRYPMIEFLKQESEQVFKPVFLAADNREFEIDDKGSLSIINA